MEMHDVPEAMEIAMARRRNIETKLTGAVQAP
jgi:hypothetical protein